ncbi:hypothetical protein SAMN05660226_02295 [Parapedobacter luteus]|uniref:Outer membrane protein beta-barrel domain-containing protein n=1 Tax=Parapedobacter luteus TaxID=623280 RepID=A0A1T5CSD1_9SPHI|nr:hypothetical protein [Parapedobacter luteus]SKB62379.1 hypothetical protein SAMN05660226_02295 [Parapedobacter luteus]
MNTRFILLLLFIPMSIYAQDEDKSLGLTLEQHNLLINKYLAKQAGTDEGAEILGNYASFDPTNGAFVLKGTIPLGKPDSEKFSYLGLSINGDLRSNSYTALFSDYKLNTNVGAQVQYNIRVGGAETISENSDMSLLNYRLRLNKERATSQTSTFYEQSEKAKQEFDLAALILKRTEIQSHLLQKNIETLWSQIPSDLLKNSEWIARIRDLTYELQEKEDLLQDNKDTNNQTEVNRLQESIKTIKIQITDAQNRLPKELHKDHVLLDKIQREYKKLDTVIRERNLLKFKLDSLNLLAKNRLQIKAGLENEAKLTMEKKKKELLEGMQLAGLKMKWLSLNAAFGVKKYHTYNSGEIYAAQIAEEKLLTYRFGISYNIFHIDDLDKRYWYLNIGGFMVKDNNTALLSTTEIIQDVVTKNATGDTTRKISKKYNAFTDEVIDGVQWELSPDFYYLFGEKTSGFHIKPILAIRHKLPTYANLSLGYVVSFTNRKKDSPAINTELYYRIGDIFNNLDRADSGEQFRKGDEIGVKIGVPFQLKI